MVLVHTSPGTAGPSSRQPLETDPSMHLGVFPWWGWGLQAGGINHNRAKPTPRPMGNWYIPSDTGEPGWLSLASHPPTPRLEHPGELRAFHWSRPRRVGSSPTWAGGASALQLALQSPFCGGPGGNNFRLVSWAMRSPLQRLSSAIRARKQPPPVS